MVRVYLEYKNNKWNEVEHSYFWIYKFLFDKLISLKKIQKKKWDGVIIIDGKERSGKSVLGMIIGWFLSDTKLSEKNFAKGLEDAGRKIENLPDGSVLIFDEGSTMFSSKDSTTKEQKKLVKILDVVGQKNLIFIICLPCIFDLNKTIAVRRSLFLCHVYPDEDYNRGNFAFYGEGRKKTLYIFGKKNYDSYNYPDADFHGEYFEFQPPFYQSYLDDVKAKTLKSVLDDAKPQKSSHKTIVELRKQVLMNIINAQIKLSQAKIGKMLGISQRMTSNMIKEIEEEQITQIP